MQRRFSVSVFYCMRMLSSRTANVVGHFAMPEVRLCQ